MNALLKIAGSLKGRHIIQAWSGFIVVFLSTAPLLAQSTITTIAGGRDPVNGGQATAAAFGNPYSVTPDGSGGFYFSVGFPRHSVYRVAANGTVTIIAGSSIQGFSGDGGAATSAPLSEPAGLALRGSGNLFIVDTANHRVRKVTPAGIITTVAGIGTFGYSGDGGPATSAQLNNPWGVAIDGNGRSEERRVGKKCRSRW